MTGGPRNPASDTSARTGVEASQPFLEDDMKKIPLTQGQFALVDDADFDWLNQWKWCFYKDGRTGYAGRAIKIAKTRKNKVILMHRLILKSKHRTDHRDGDGLNNQRNNIRPASSSQNNRNRCSALGSSSKYLGVSWKKYQKRWVAQIKDKFVIHLGYFIHEIDAAKAYNKAAQKYHGEFARLNVID